MTIDFLATFHGFFTSNKEKNEACPWTVKSAPQSVVNQNNTLPLIVVLDKTLLIF